MSDFQQEYILCAAIKRIKPREGNHYHDNDIYDIEIGYRHGDILHRFEGEVSTDRNAQGFYTSKGRFVSRKEAYEIACEAHQIKDEILIRKRYNLEDDVSLDLYSEDLY